MNSKVTGGQWSLYSAGGGLLIWLLYLLLDRAYDWNYVTTVERLLLLAVLVFTPLALTLIQRWHEDDKVSIPFWWACRLQPVAATLVALAFLQPTGVWAGLLSVLWLFCTALIALVGLTGWQTTAGRLPVYELVLRGGMLYLPVGAGWLLLSRFGARPLAFPAVIVLLTGVHFHYTGFAVPVITAMTGRFLAKNKLTVRAYPWLAGAIVVAMPLIAAGITVSPWLEVVGVVLLFTAIVGLAGVIGFVVLPQVAAPLPRFFLAVAAVAMVVAITPALLYGIGEFTDQSLITIPRMVQLHGLTNAFGFVACGLLGWLLVERTAAKQVVQPFIQVEA
ncbi:MAG: hypothetical protein DYG89_05280 [Caldilinea sp. CFX5]|nr:hypothetical protein [Caldilinea sp. CFX5]